MKGSKRTVKIGVCGIHGKAGATHVSHMIALYLSGSRRKRVVVVEGDGRASLRHLERYLFGNVERGCFSTRRCTYRYDMADWEEERAEYVIYDTGSGGACKYNLLFSCDICIAIGNGGVFCSVDWEEFFKAREVGERIRLRGLKDWRFIRNHAQSGKVSTLKIYLGGEEQKIRIYGLGVEEN
ncbi:MAG: hypothetical protein K2N63_17310, partial [Lachnospiraceae bacterium]|nr:hypothetical protein [Lachnospiraceae bacterium]